MKKARCSFEKEDYECKKDWPEDSFLQCGNSGIVFIRNSNKSYETAFFEAFLMKTFLRGEGRSIEEAEANTFEKYLKIINCKGHEFERNVKNMSEDTRYGKCKHCGYSTDNIFPPIYHCKDCGKPEVNFKFNVNNYKTGDQDVYCMTHFMEHVKQYDFNKLTKSNVEKKIAKKEGLDLNERESFNFNSMVKCHMFSMIESWVVSSILDLYLKTFTKEEMKLKFKNEFEIYDSIKEFMKESRQVVFDNFSKIAVDFARKNDLKLSVLDGVRMREDLKHLNPSLYRVTFLIKNQIPVLEELRIYEELNLPYANKLQELQHVIKIIEKWVAKNEKKEAPENKTE